MPRQDLAMTFLLAMAFRSASASCSRLGAASGRSAGRRMAAGTVWSINWSRLAAPMSASIWLISVVQGPMWRPMNSSCCSRAESGRLLMSGSISRVGWNGMRGHQGKSPALLRCTGLLRQKSNCLGGVGDGLVGSGVEQGVDVGHVVRGHLEQPGAVGVGIDRFRSVGGGLVHFGDGAADRGVDVSGGLDRFNDGDFLFGIVMGADFRQL